MLGIYSSTLDSNTIQFYEITNTIQFSHTIKQIENNIVFLNTTIRWLAETRAMQSIPAIKPFTKTQVLHFIPAIYSRYQTVYGGMSQSIPDIKPCTEAWVNLFQISNCVRRHESIYSGNQTVYGGTSQSIPGIKPCTEVRVNLFRESNSIRRHESIVCQFKCKNIIFIKLANTLHSWSVEISKYNCFLWHNDVYMIVSNLWKLINAN